MTLIASLRISNRDLDCGSDKDKSRTESSCKVAQFCAKLEDNKVDESETKELFTNLRED